MTETVPQAAAGVHQDATPGGIRPWGALMWATVGRLYPGRLGLKAGLLLPVVLLSALGFATMQLVESQLLRQQEDQLLERYADMALNLVAEHLNEGRLALADDTDLLADQVDLPALMKAQDEDALRRALAPFVVRLRWDDVRLLDKHGRTLAGLGIIHEESVPAHLLFQGLRGFAASSLEANSQGLLLTAVSPVLEGAEVVGAVVVSRRVPLAELVHDWGGAQPVLALYQQGALADTTAAPGPLRDALAAPLPLPARRQELVHKLEGLGYRVVFREVTEWTTMAALAARGSLVATSDSVGLIRLGVTVLVGGLALLVMVVLVGHFSDRLHEVVAATVEVAHGDYRRRITPSPVRELAQLGEAVNRMAEQLQARVGELERYAFHDDLTGLPNRSLFMDRVEHAVLRSQRSGETVAVLFVDLDDFKLINDTLGHAAGDALLRSVAAALQHCVRSGDTVARLGGDEFAVLLEPVENETFAMNVAQRIVQLLGEPVRLNGQQVFMRCSVGLAISAGGSVPADQLVQHADMAMYRAKSEGKGRYAVYEPEMSAAAWERLRTEEELQRALRADELRLYYQPVVDLRTGKVVGAEALLRWQHPTRGLLAPGAFVEVGEQTGLIVPIEEWALREAMLQLQAWQERLGAETRFMMNVNLSSRQFRDRDLVGKLVRLAGAAGVAPSQLTLEISEQTAVTVADSNPQLLRALRGVGFNLAIDDFGVGRSSLSYFRESPINGVKLDLSFISGLGSNQTDTAIVEAVMGFALSLGLNVIAEGIESTEQLTRLRALGCGLGQGYLFGPALPQQAFEVTLFGEATKAIVQRSYQDGPAGTKRRTRAA